VFSQDPSDYSAQVGWVPLDAASINATAFNQCLSTTAPEHWFCADGYPYEAVDCQDELNDLFVRLGF
jgi:hypothetical protein